MGWYQWQLLVVVGILSAIVLEFKPRHGPLVLALSQNIGLLFGAMFWGFGCNIFGRRLAFNMTLGVTSIFGLISAFSPNLAAIGIFNALWSVGVGGNLSVSEQYFLS